MSELFTTPQPAHAGSVHACAGLEHCQRCWLDLERASIGTPIDLKPHAQLLVVAAFDLSRQLVAGGQHGIGQKLTDPQRILANSLEGKAAELAYAVAVGIDPRLILNDKRSKDDFTDVDVKVVKRRPQGWSSFTLAEGTYSRDRQRRNLRFVGVELSDDGWTATLVGSITVPQLNAAITAGLCERFAPRGRPDGGHYYEVRAHLLKSNLEEVTA